MYWTGNSINNILITLYGDGWLTDLRCVPETNIILYANPTLMKI